MITLNNQDITSLVDITSITTNDTLDESLASGSMVIPLTTQNTPYARFSEVIIDGLLFLVAEDIVRLVKKTDPKQYRHEISLIEPTKILQKRVIPNLTITQPKGQIINYIFSVFSLPDEQEFNNTNETLNMQLKSQSQDTSVVDGLILKNTKDYDIFIDYRFRNQQFQSFLFPNLDGDVEIQVETYYDNDVIDTKLFTIDGKGILETDKFISGSYKVSYKPTVANGTISVKVRTLGIYNTELDTQDNAWAVSFNIKPSQKESEVDNNIYLDQVVDKLLQFHQDFRLSETTRAKIEQIKSPEFTFQNYTLYDALKEVANYESAIVYLGEDDFKTIHFYYYDQVLDDGVDFADQEQTEYLDGFTDGFEINATNVIRDDDQLYAIYEPDQISWMTVRGETDERGVQIIDTQTALQLEHGIYRPIQVLVKGLAFDMIDGNDQTISFPNTQVWDITNYVVEQQRYNTFETEEVTNQRGTVKRKSNTIYYTQGQPLIQGLGFTGTVPPAWNENLTPNFAIVEAILNTAKDENPTYIFTPEYLVAPSIHDLQFRIRHIPYSNVRLSVYKDNTRGNNIMYFNEQAPLNDMELLGKIAQENVNRSGNRVVKYEGFTNDNQLLLGSKNGNEVLVNYTISRTPTINKFVAEYAVGYANLSNYVGIDSQYRQYEVPNDTIVSRRDKLTQFFNMTASNNAPIVSVPDYLDFANNVLFDSMFANFKSSITGSRPTYARVVIDGDKVVQSTIDAYRMGKTLGLAINMLDNYSAGIKKREKEINVRTSITSGENITVKVQEDAQYTDEFGRFTNAEIEFYDGGGAVSLAESDLYPDNDKAGVFKLLDYTYTVNKDAREQWGFIYEIVFQGDTTADEKTIVYDGFVKYNRLATEITPTTVEIRFLEKGYLPERNLDINRTTLGTGTVSVPSGERYLQIQATAPVGEYEGIILTINKEPIIAIQSSDYDFGLQVTKYIYPRAFEENEYQDGITSTILFDANAVFEYFLTKALQDTITFDVLAVTTVQLNQNGLLADSFTFDTTQVIAIQLDADGSASSSFNFDASATIDTQLNAGRGVNDSFNFNAGASFIYQLLVEQAIQDTINFNADATFTQQVVQLGGTSDTITFNIDAVITTATSEIGSVSDNINFTASATFSQEVFQTYELRGYATATPVNVIVDFDNIPEFSFTFQTFEQIIDTQVNGTDVTVTAPSSYTLNGFTYVFVDWRVDETSQTSTNRVFTTTLDQNKTLRLRYIAFA